MWIGRPNSASTSPSWCMTNRRRSFTRRCRRQRRSSAGARVALGHGSRRRARRRRRGGARNSRRGERDASIARLRQTLAAARRRRLRRTAGAARALDHSRTRSRTRAPNSPIDPRAALIYRLSGDWNPLHIRPRGGPARRLRSADPAWPGELRDRRHRGRRAPAASRRPGRRRCSAVSPAWCFPGDALEFRIWRRDGAGRFSRASSASERCSIRASSSFRRRRVSGDPDLAARLEERLRNCPSWPGRCSSPRRRRSSSRNAGAGSSARCRRSTRARPRR